MQNPNDVTTKAFDGVVLDISNELGITDKRFYEILARDNYYVKFWQKMGTPLGIAFPDRLELIRADFNARCARLIDGRSTTSPSKLNKEMDEFMQLVLERAPITQRRQAAIEAIAELQKELASYDTGGSNA